MKMQMSEILIPDSFKKTKPKNNKYYACKNFYETYGKMDRDIYVDSNNTLIDGYIAYLVYKNLKIDKVKVKRVKNNQKSRKRKRFILFLNTKR